MIDEHGAAVVEIRGLTKRYGGELALDHVDLELRAGEVHALLGENGAGKSTLIKILAGVVAADEGSIETRGSLAFVHQDLGLCEHLSVAENVALAMGYERRRRLISFPRTERRVAEKLAALSIDISPRALVGELAQDERVMVAVARAFALDARAIVLDEVSSSLPGPEVSRLSEALRAARRSGVAFIYVTHRLSEIFGLADRVTVLRDGRRIVTEEVAGLRHDDVVAWILGSAQAAEERQAVPRPRREGEPRLRVEGLIGPGLAEPVSFDAAPGEVVAFCGLVGCGARELAEMLGGARLPTSGRAMLDGAALPLGRPHALRAAGCTYVPGDRQHAGGVFTLSIRENLFLHRHAGDGFVRGPSVERAGARALVERFAVRPPRAVDRSLATLSGGNQQKVIAGRALRGVPKLLVVDDPTAGVDVGSRAQMHEIMRRAADDGTVLVMASTDFEEVAAQADRALVLSHGRVHAELTGAALTEERLAQASYGAGSPESLLTVE